MKPIFYSFLFAGLLSSFAIGQAQFVPGTAQGIVAGIEFVNADGSKGFVRYRGATSNCWDLWTPGNVASFDLCNILIGPFYAEYDPVDISDSGDEVLVTKRSVVSPDTAMLWSPTQTVELSGDPGGGMTPYLYTEATCISGDGRVVFGTGVTNVAPLEFERVTWVDQGAPTPICGSGPNACSIKIVDCNYDGSIALGHMDSATQREWYLWNSASGLSLIGTGPLGNGGTHGSLSADGQVAFYMLTDGTIFRYTAASGNVDIGTPGVPLGLHTLSCDASGDRALVNSLDPGVWDAGIGWRPISALLSTQDSRLVQQADVVFRGGFYLSQNGKVLTGTLWFANVPVVVVLYLDSPRPGTIGEPLCGPSRRNTTGLHATISAIGSANAVDNDLTIRAMFVPENHLGYFLSSPAGNNFLMPVGSRGNLCLGGGAYIGRHNRPHEIRTSGAEGVFELTLDLTDVPTNIGTTTLLAGSTHYFQGWFRDTLYGGISTSHFTDAVAVEFQ